MSNEIFIRERSNNYESSHHRRFAKEGRHPFSSIHFIDFDRASYQVPIKKHHHTPSGAENKSPMNRQKSVRKEIRYIPVTRPALPKETSTPTLRSTLKQRLDFLRNLDRPATPEPRPKSRSIIKKKQLTGTPPSAKKYKRLRFNFAVEYSDSTVGTLNCMEGRRSEFLMRHKIKTLLSKLSKAK